ncbi:hypothetical protein [Cytobacillus kochii]|uniref:hypothetical protein n=1 Tax=Cytobacillus kochii TaxID=859143 RepID=UPI00402AF681
MKKAELASQMRESKNKEILEKIQEKIKEYEGSLQPQQKMNRAERRRKERNQKKFDQIQTFSKLEVESMNEQAYKHGVAFTLVAAREVLNLGEVRLDRIRKKIKEYEFEYFQQLRPFPNDIEEVIRYKGEVKNARK